MNGSGVIGAAEVVPCYKASCMSFHPAVISICRYGPWRTARSDLPRRAIALCLTACDI